MHASRTTTQTRRHITDSPERGAVANSDAPQALVTAENVTELQSEGVAEIVTRQKDEEIGKRQAELAALGALARSD